MKRGYKKTMQKDYVLKAADYVKEKDSTVESIKIAVGKIVDGTTHIDVAKTAMFIGKSLGLNERLVNYAHIEIRNKLNEAAFKKVDFKDRVIFLPHCLRNANGCRAKYTDQGLQCARCGLCKITELIGLAEKYKYKAAFVTPGGSMAYKIMQAIKPRAAVGVACYNELTMGMDKAAEFNIPTQGILLAREGCKDTDVNLEEVEEIISQKAK